jgi:hypothetical protein
LNKRQPLQPGAVVETGTEAVISVNLSLHGRRTFNKLTYERILLLKFPKRSFSSATGDYTTRSAIEIVLERVGRLNHFTSAEAARELGLDLFGRTLTIGSILVDCQRFVPLDVDFRRQVLSVCFENRLRRSSSGSLKACRNLSNEELFRLCLVLTSGVIYGEDH